MTLAVHVAGHYPPTRYPSRLPMSNGRSSLHIDKPVDPRRRSVVIKHSHFQNKYGKKHHTFDREKAPYPLSYDKKFTDLYV